jgi:ABC-type branched-subunit amino acid transport system substrate-binding protein
MCKYGVQQASRGRISVLTSGTKIRRAGQGNSAGKKQQVAELSSYLHEFLVFGATQARGGVVLALTAGALLLVASPALAEKKYDPGAGDTEIKIGQTHSYSGPASSFSISARVASAYYKMLNDRGGINGRKITMISLDDGYNPSKTVEQTRRLVEQDEVLALFGSLGTANNVSVRKYLNQRKIPQLLVASSSSQWNNPVEYPYSTSLFLSADQEAAAVARYILANKPDAKIAVLYQNDDYGKDYLKAFQGGLGPRADSMIVKAANYQPAEPTVDQQIVALKFSGADVFLNAGTAKFAAMAIRKAAELQWKPLQFIGSSNISLKNVLEPAGFHNATGIVTFAVYKDPSDPQMAENKDVLEFFQFMKQNLPNEDARDFSTVGGYVTAQLTAHILEKCGDDLTHDNVLKQATNLKNPPIGMLRAGVTISTSTDSYLPFSSAQLIRFDGAKWIAFDEPVPMKAIPSP